MKKVKIEGFDANGKSLYTQNQIPTELADLDDGNSAGKCEQFTYIVDSDEALSIWVNNTQGYDFSRVLIKSGEWNISGTIIPSQTKTEEICGEMGACLVYNGEISGGFVLINDLSGYTKSVKNIKIKASVAGHGIFRAIQRANNLVNVSIEFSNVFLYNPESLSPDSISLAGFRQCKKLYNCSVSCSFADDESGVYSGWGILLNAFDSCEDLVSCQYTLSQTQEDPDSFPTGDNSAYCGFYSCKRLSSCSGSATITNVYSNSLVSQLSNIAKYCYYIQNCYANTVVSTLTEGFVLGFAECYDLSNCQAETTVSTFENIDNGSFATPIMGCEDLANCNASLKITSGNGTGSQSAFELCNAVVNCKGVARAYAGLNAYGFRNCKALSHCAPDPVSPSTTGTYSVSCYADFGGTQSVADTAAGGYNQS